MPNKRLHLTRAPSVAGHWIVVKRDPAVGPLPQSSVSCASQVKCSVVRRMTLSWRADSMTRLWLTMASLLVLSSAGQAQTSATADTILRIQRELAQATLWADAAVYEQYLADDYTFTSAAGRVSSKAEVIAEVRASEFRFESFQTDKEVVRIYGDAAVVIGRASGRGINPGGEPFAGEYRFTAVYVRTDLVWRLVAWQTTAIPKG